MNPVDRFNCVLRYSSLPQELQAQVRLPWLANVLEWHALRDAALVLVDIRDNTTLVENRAALPIAVTSTCDKVKMFALFFFSCCLRMAFWTCNSHLQLQQNPPADAGGPAVQPLDLNELVDDVVNGRRTQEEVLALIEEHVPEEQRRNFRASFLAVFSDEPLAQPHQMADAPGRVALMEDQDRGYEEALRADRARLEQKREAIKNWNDRHSEEEFLADLGQYFEDTLPPLELILRCNHIIDHADIDQICRKMDEDFAFLADIPDETVKNTLQLHFDSWYQLRKELILQELKEVINQGFADFREAKPLLEFFEGECIPLCAIRKTIDFLREKDPQRDVRAIREYLKSRTEYILSEYFGIQGGLQDKPIQEQKGHFTGNKHSLR